MIKGGFAFLVFILLMGFVSASVQKGNLSHSIEKEYVFGESITGWINISLTNHPVNAILNTSFGAIKLLDLIDLNPSFQITCTPSDCMQTYKTTGAAEAASKEFTLNRDESKVVGFNFTGTEVQIQNLKFAANITSDSAETEKQALKIDLLDDGDYDWVPYAPSGIFSDKKYGCYLTSTSAVSITTSKYCNKLSLTESPNFKVGANVIASVGGEVPFKFTIRDTSNVEIGSCEATATASGEINCLINSSNIEGGNYYSCIETKTSSGNEKYKINSETTAACGYATTQTNKRDFEIFVQTEKYGAIGTFTLNNNETKRAKTNTIIEGEINDYIAERYNGNCENGCVVPVRFFSGTDSHKITIARESESREFVSYSSSGVSGEEIMNLYDVSLTPATMSSGFQKLNLDWANFSIPESFGKKSFSVKIDGTNIFAENITIERTAQINSLFPVTTAAAYPTFFTVDVSEAPNLTIKGYRWDFGDGQTESTTENGVEHAYNSIGSFDLSVTVMNSNGENSSKIFTITVESPKDAVESLLQQGLDSLSAITSTVQEMPPAYQEAVNSKMNLDELNNALSGLQQRTITATQDQDYVSIMAEILGLTIPLSFASTESAEAAIFYPKEENVDADILKGITGESYSSNNKEGYDDAILRFNLDYLKAFTDFNDFSAVYSDGNSESVIKTFRLNIGADSKLKGAYFIVKNPGDLIFEDNYEQKEKNGYYYIQLTGDEQTIGFSTTEDVGFLELPAFVSPAISELQLFSSNPADDNLNANKINFAGFSITKQTLFILIMLALVFAAGIIYVILQQWYKKKYEGYLFKNKNDLYNVVSYVQNMKKQGVEDGKIASGLKKSGWNSEQIRYLMKKYYGKKTGL